MAAAGGGGGPAADRPAADRPAAPLPPRTKAVLIPYKDSKMIAGFQPPKEGEEAPDEEAYVTAYVTTERDPLGLTINHRRANPAPHAHALWSMVRPPPPALRLNDDAILSREPGDLLPAKAGVKKREDDFENFLLRRQLQAEVHKLSAQNFVHKPTSINSIDPHQHSRANALCARLFCNETLSEEQVLTYCFPDTDLVGPNYDWYAAARGKKEDSSSLLAPWIRETEVRVAFVCLLPGGGGQRKAHVSLSQQPTFRFRRSCARP